MWALLFSHSCWLPRMAPRTGAADSRSLSRWRAKKVVLRRLSMRSTSSRTDVSPMFCTIVLGRAAARPLVLSTSFPIFIWRKRLFPCLIFFWPVGSFTGVFHCVFCFTIIHMTKKGPFAPRGCLLTTCVGAAKDTTSTASPFGLASISCLM
jgi:hypothetical protein